MPKEEIEIKIRPRRVRMALMLRMERELDLVLEAGITGLQLRNESFNWGF